MKPDSLSDERLKILTTVFEQNEKKTGSSIDDITSSHELITDSQKNILFEFIKYGEYILQNINKRNLLPKLLAERNKDPEYAIKRVYRQSRQTYIKHVIMIILHFLQNGFLNEKTDVGILEFNKKRELKGKNVKTEYKEIHHIWDYIAEHLADYQTVKYIQKKWDSNDDDEERTKLIQFIVIGLYN